jgi:hypothetical protein
VNRRLLITLATAILLVLGTLVAINFAKGYRFNLKQKKVVGSGLLVANSFPTGASVYIDDKLTTATDNTLNLSPGDYKVKIVKDGFIPWEKNLQLKKELVAQTNAQLFPAVPNLRALTFTGATNIAPSPDGSKIAYVVTTATGSANLKSGLWVLELNSRPLALSRDPRVIAKPVPYFNLDKARITWSPDSKQILVSNALNSYLLDIDHTNDLNSTTEASARLPLILSDWEEELKLKNEERLQKLPKQMQQIIKQSIKSIYFAPDEEKILYTATASASLPENMLTPPPATNTQPETRNIEPNKIYVYDLQEDKNFYITTLEADKNSQAESKISKTEQRLNALDKQYSPLTDEPVQWFPTSRHLIAVEKDKISILEYDGTNKATVYAGPFKESFVYPWPDGSRLVILTTLNPDSSTAPNLYAIDLK